MKTALPIDMDELHEEAIAYGCSLDQEAEVREMLPEDFDDAPGVRRVKRRLRMGEAILNGRRMEERLKTLSAPMLTPELAQEFVAAGKAAFEPWAGKR